MPLKLVQPYLKTGNKTFYIRGSLKGEDVFKSTGLTNKAKAEEVRIKLENEVIDAAVHGKRATVTFDVAVEHYLKQGGSRRFLGEYNEQTGRWSGLVGYFGERKLTTIEQGDLDEAAIALYPNCNHQTRNRQCHAVFIAIWNKAADKGWCERRSWKRPRKAKGTMKAKSTRAGTKATTYERAWQFVSKMSPAPAMLMTAFFYTGMRPIELFSLEAKHIDIEARWITLPNSKTGEERHVPIHEALVPLLTGLKKRGGVIFRTPRGQPYEPKDEDGQGGGQMKSAINGARRRSGITDIAPYTGRHTVSSFLAMNGAHDKLIDVILGHANDEGDIAKRYVTVERHHMLKAIGMLPVIEAWANAPWMQDPLAWAGKLAEGTGQRNDLSAAAA